MTHTLTSPRPPASGTSGRVPRRSSSTSTCPVCATRATKLDYREKIAHHLKLFYGKTFKEGSYWYTNPNENEFFRAVFAKAAGKENADDVDAAGIEDIFFKKENRQMGIDAKALGRYCSERQLKALFAACPASSEEGDVCIEVPAPASASLGAPVKSDEENEEEEEERDARLGLARSSCARRGWNG